MQEALEKAAVLTSIVKQYPDFRFLNQDAIAEMLDASAFTESQKRELLYAPDRTNHYKKLRFWYDLNDARKSLYQLLALKGIMWHMPNGRKVRE